MPLPTYVLVTPARNESEFIELTIKSVVAQTVLPLKWAIVSDGSTDGTDGIVTQYAEQYPWIELVRTPDRSERDFAGKVHAFNAGYARLADLQYDVIASLDADISFDAEYFSFLLEKLAADPSLGVVGTPFREISQESYDYRFVDIAHVSGACQVFRLACFRAIGGYRPIRGGSIDHIAIISARMKGWKTRTFTEKVCLHHRKVGTAQSGLLRARFKYGVKDYVIGNHPLWELFRIAYQMTKKPVVAGGAALAFGYLSALLSGLIRGSEKPVSPELVAFHRREQMIRLRKFFFSSRSSAAPALQQPASRA